MRRELITWRQVYRLAWRLADRIRRSGFKPDPIVAMARGGYVPARLLCDFLDIHDLGAFAPTDYHIYAAIPALVPRDQMQRDLKARAAALSIDLGQLRVLSLA